MLYKTVNILIVIVTISLKTIAYNLFVDLMHCSHESLMICVFTSKNFMHINFENITSDQTVSKVINTLESYFEINSADL